MSTVTHLRRFFFFLKRLLVCYSEEIYTFFFIILSLFVASFKGQLLLFQTRNRAVPQFSSIRVPEKLL